MSAFFCDKQTIDNVVAAWTYGHALPLADPDALGKMLWTLNAEAVIHRYNLQGKEEALQMHGSVKAYVYDNSRPPSEAEMLRSVACLAYQCDEAPFDESPLFKALDNLEKRMATTIPRFGPEYEAAYWG